LRRIRARAREEAERAAKIAAAKEVQGNNETEESHGIEGNIESEGAQKDDEGGAGVGLKHTPAIR